MNHDIHTKLCHVSPSELSDGSGSGLPRLLINIITRACYDKGLKKLAGWRGMAPTPGDPESWTFKLKGHRGIFGVGCEGKRGDNEKQTARFLICHFPDTEDEELVELMSLHAATTANRPDYLEKVRDFACREEMREPFLMGHLNFSLGQDASHLLLCLESPLKKRVVALDGVRLPQGTEEDYLVPPGECEEDFPAFSLASVLFNAICAAVTYTLKTPPCFYRHAELPGQVVAYNAQGEITTQETDEWPLIRQTVGYGDLSSVLKASGPNLAGDTIWQEGETLPDTLPPVIWQAVTPDTALASLSTPLLDKRPQLIVLTGFLGSGKTTFINNFVEYHTSRNNFVAVVQNEIGETGLDGKLLEGNCNVVEIDEGCVCCTLAGQLSTGITELLGQFTPESIILETTGLANTFNLLDEIDELKELVRFDSVTTIVDCANALTTLETFDVARDQVRAADIVILNKTDLTGPEQTGAVEAKVRRLNAKTLILGTTHGNISPGLLYDDAVGCNDAAGPDASNPAPTHGHHVCHGEEGIGTLKIPLDHPLERKAFLTAIKELPPDILRVKGIVRFTDAEAVEVCQYVGGRIDLSRHTGPYDKEGFLIVIGRDIHNQPLPGVLYDAYHSTGRPVDGPHRPLFHRCACGHH
ncbi:GTP-binding protein [Desulfoluna sp.]|uniref:CobW family GTP-binding protein n=1 Tax=Desulfoluna sp. TaxID=2045199 RepID=UPI00262D0396|nr:GTP-binding protein [Desulfoluna sp.]